MHCSLRFWPFSLQLFHARKTSSQNNRAAFSESSDLKSVTVSSGVKSIGTTRLATITLPSTLTSIGVDAFVGNTYLKSVYCKAVTPPTVGKDAFYDLSDDLKIYVPQASESAYRSAEYWESMTIIGY